MYSRLDVFRAVFDLFLTVLFLVLVAGSMVWTAITMGRDVTIFFQIVIVAVCITAATLVVYTSCGTALVMHSIATRDSSWVRPFTATAAFAVGLVIGPPLMLYFLITGRIAEINELNERFSRVSHE
jgi:hypothetical protein